MRRWHHGHSLLAGLGGGLLLDTHPYLMLALGFALGVAVALGGRFARRSAAKTGRVVEAQTALLLERTREVRARRKAQIDRRRASRDALAREYRRGVIDGSLK